MTLRDGIADALASGKLKIEPTQQNHNSTRMLRDPLTAAMLSGKVQVKEDGPRKIDESFDAAGMVKTSKDLVKSYFKVGSDKMTTEAFQTTETPKAKAKVINESKDYDGMSHEAHELVLHADNDAQLHHSSHMPIIRNLQRKMDKGNYDHEKAKQVWRYHADRAAQSYHKQHGSGHQAWHQMFPVSARKEAAEHFADREQEEMKHGNYKNTNESLSLSQRIDDVFLEALYTGKATLDELAQSTYKKYFKASDSDRRTAEKTKKDYEKEGDKEGADYEKKRADKRTKGQSIAKTKIKEAVEAALSAKKVV